MSVSEELERTLDEYRSIFNEDLNNIGRTKDLNWDSVQWKLCSIGDWTSEGAKEIVRLAHDYGGFMLRNALAVADVFGIEDGGLGY